MKTSILVLLIAYFVLNADTLNVPAEYSTIQEGLNNAGSSDTVLVAAGVYIENIVWPETQNLTLLSTAGPEYTTIDGGGVGSVITMESTSGLGDNTVIEGFTIRNGNDAQGGGIFISHEAPIIRGNIIRDNIGSSTGGGGIEAYCAEGILVEDNILEDNTCTGLGSAIRLYVNEGPVHFLNNLVKDNTGNTAVDIYALNGCDVFIDSSVFEYNTGMGLRLIHSDNNSNIGKTTNCIFRYNGQGVHLGGDCEADSLTDCQIYGNNGNGIFSDEYTYRIISYCEIFYNGNNGIELGAGANAKVTNCNIYGNGGYGVNAYQYYTTDARNCWWGNPSGPGGSGPGTGDEVSEWVLFDPWLLEMGLAGGFEGVEITPIVQPNPIVSNGSVMFTVDVPGKITLRVFDLAGRPVETIQVEQMELGQRSLEFDASEWSSGLYLMRIEFSEGFGIARCAVLR